MGQNRGTSSLFFGVQDVPPVATAILFGIQVNPTINIGNCADQAQRDRKKFVSIKSC